jgi:chemotaxis protein MotB
MAPSNRRISIIVMNRDAEDRFFRPPTDTPEPAPASIVPPRPEVVPQVRP